MRCLTKREVTITVKIRVKIRGYASHGKPVNGVGQRPNTVE